MKIFAEKSHYKEEDRKYLIEVLRPVWNDKPIEEKINIYGEWVSRYTFSENIEEADICFLPMTWDYYEKFGLVNLAKKAVAEAQRHNKPIILFIRHDFIPKLPFSNVILFEHSGYRSRQGEISHFSLPPLFPDFQKMYCSGNPTYRQKTNQPPVVGFCGAVANSPVDYLRSISGNWKHWIEFDFGVSKWEPPSYPTSIFRKRVLDRFTNSTNVTTNFIFRKQFRAGMDISNDNDPLRLAFIENILGSDYTICMRGEGNYSFRFYETLDLGRIPVFIDTDCLLPWDNAINYRDYFPWIEYHEIPYAAEKLIDYHNFISDDDFVDLQKQCRNLWEEQFTYQKYYGHFIEFLNTSIMKNKTGNT